MWPSLVGRRQLPKLLNSITAWLDQLANKWWLILIFFILITYPAYQALLHPGLYTSHDLEGHFIRLVEFDRAIDDGMWPVRWAKRLNLGLGYPFFNFDYPLLYYLLSGLSRVGFGYVNALKIIFVISFPLSGWFFYLWLKGHFRPLAAVVGGMVFTIVPYHFVNVYVRANPGETLGLMLLPLLLFLSDRLWRIGSLRVAVGLGASWAAVIGLHNLSGMISLGVLILYNGWLWYSFRFRWRWQLWLISLGIGLGLSCWFWWPALTEKGLIVLDQEFSEYYLKNFPDWPKLLYSKWGYGQSNVGVDRGEMSVQIGLVQLAILGISTGLVFWRRFRLKEWVTFWWLFGLCSILLMLEISRPLWDQARLLQYLQFPWRLLGLVSLAAAALAGAIVDLTKPRWILVIVVIMIVGGLFYFNRNHWRTNEYYQPPPYWFDDQPMVTTTAVGGEHRPKWQGNQLKFTEELISSTPLAVITDLEWKTNQQRFTVESSAAAVIKSRTVYYPGWQVSVDGQIVKLADPFTTDGLIAFEVPIGRHEVQVKWVETPSRVIANLITTVSIILVLILLLI